MARSQAASKLVAAPVHQQDSVEDLVRKLINETQQGHPPQNEAESAPIVDVHLDGVRYTLLRTPAGETFHLSPREQEIARLIIEGLPNKCIGAILEISTWTVATHVRRMFMKLGVTTRAAMVARIMDAGMVCAGARPGTR
jgi:DNA-binding CsgD family transcriptional regulator